MRNFFKDKALAILRAATIQEPVITAIQEPRRLPLYIPNPMDIKYPDDDITPPQVCPMNEGDQLCIHRTANTAAILLAAGKLGYRLTLEPTVEKCHYQADYDHYSVEKKSD